MTGRSRLEQNYLVYEAARWRRQINAVFALYRAHRWEQSGCYEPFGPRDTVLVPERNQSSENFYSTGSCAHMGHP